MKVIFQSVSGRFEVKRGRERERERNREGRKEDKKRHFLFVFGFE